MAAEQTERLEREQARAQADAARLEREETATAERQRRVLEIQAEAEAHSMKIQAEASAQQIRTEATAKADAAVQEAEAAKSRAAAEKVQAEATRAKTAAEGLAKAEVAARNAEVALAQADADKAAGLAQAEVTEAQARAAAAGERERRQVEVETKARLATLYEANSQLFELEKLRIRFAHELEMATAQQQTQIAMMQALATNMEIKVIGNAGQMGQILSELMTLRAGVATATEEFPFLRSLFGNGGQLLAGLPSALGEALQDVQPRVFASLTVADLVERLAAVANGDSDLRAALNGLRQDSNFRVVGNLPVMELLGNLLGSMRNAPANSAPANGAPPTK
jgi:colicin import membrane protein